MNELIQKLILEITTTLNCSVNENVSFQRAHKYDIDMITFMCTLIEAKSSLSSGFITEITPVSGSTTKSLSYLLGDTERNNMHFLFLTLLSSDMI